MVVFVLIAEQQHRFGGEFALGRARVRVTGAVDPALLDTILAHPYRR